MGKVADAVFRQVVLAHLDARRIGSAGGQVAVPDQATGGVTEALAEIVQHVISVEYRVVLGDGDEHRLVIATLMQAVL
ncbi:hypothetical protein PSYMO_13269, partial [Pseudomonas amygdali pv. mori str. 301020]